MRSKLFVEILEESADKTKVLVKNEVYSEPVWIEKVKVNRQNQVIEFILSQETRKQHRKTDRAESPQDAVPITNPEEVVAITSSSENLLNGLLGGSSTPEPQKTPGITSAPWVNEAAGTAATNTQMQPPPADQGQFFSGISDSTVDIESTESAYEPLTDQPEGSSTGVTAEHTPVANTIGVTKDRAAELDQEIQRLYELSRASQKELVGIGRSPVNLEPHMDICEGKLCLVVPWKEPITAQEGSIAVASPQSSSGTFSLPAWKIPLLAKQLKDQITTMGTPVYLKVAGFDFFIE